MLQDQGATISVHPIVSLKAKASSGSNIDYNTTQNQSKKIEFWSKYRQDLTFYLTITESSIKSGWFYIVIIITKNKMKKYIVITLLVLSTALVSAQKKEK
jgi:hypothetical protein